MAVAVEKQRIPMVTLVFWMLLVRLSEVFHFFDEFDTPAEHATWIAALIAMVWVGIGTALVYLLYKTFPGQTLSEALEGYLGPIIGKVLNLLLAWFFLHQAALSVRSLTDAVAAVILPRTPPVLVAAALVFVVVYAVRAGIEVIARSTVILTIGMFAAVLLITLLMTPDMRFERLLPILGPGWGSILFSSVYIASYSFYTLLLLMFLSSTETPSNTAWVLQAINVIAHSVLAFTLVLTVSTMTYMVSQNKVFEFLSVVRYVSVGEFIERIEPLLLVGWVSVAYATIAGFFLASLMATRTLLGLKDYRALTSPMGVILIVLARALFENARDRTAFLGSGEASTPYHLVFMFVLPLILLPIFHFRRRAREGHASGRRAEQG